MTSREMPASSWVVAEISKTLNRFVMMSRCVVSGFLVGRSRDAESSGAVHEASCEANLIAQGVRRRDHVISRLQCDC